MRKSTIAPPTMATPAKEKKRHPCLACCIVCLVIFLLFIGLVIGGSAFAFNKFVSPMIGGVKFGSAIRLMSGIYTGEANRKKIVTNAYTEEDLSDFYDELNAHLFQQVRSKASLEAEYAALDADAKANVLDEMSANLKWYTRYESATDKDALLKDYYVAANRYPITIAKMLSALNLGEMLGNATGADSGEAEEALSEYISTDPVGRLAAAGEAEDEAVQEGSSSSGADMLTSLLTQLHFDFTQNGLLGQFDHTQAEDYAANIATVTFNITGSQVAALVGEVVSQALSTLNLGNMVGDVAGDIDISKIYLPDYVLIPQVVVEHKTELPQNPTAEQQAEYNKNTYASLTLEVRIRDLLNNKTLQASVKSMLAEMVPMPWLADVGLAVVKGILPRTLFLTVGVYPLDADREIFIKINNYNDKLQGELAKIINAVAGEVKIFDSETTGEDEAQTQPTLLNQVNQQVVGIFSSIDEMGIPLTFVNQSDGKSVGLRLAHVQMLLSFMNAYDPTGENGITPYLFMTVLKCIFSELQVYDPPTQEDLNALYTTLQSKYGVSKTIWDGDSSFVDKAGKMLNSIDIKTNISNFDTNDKMKVDVSDRQLLSIFLKAKDDGSLDKFLGSSGEVAAAGDESSSSGSNVSEIIKGLGLSILSIKAVEGKPNVFKLSLGATLSITGILQNFIGEETSILKTLTDAIPHSLSLGISLYVHADENGKITKVGADEDGNDKTAFLINSFNETYTMRVLDTISTLMRCLSGGEGGFTTDQFTGTVESMFQKVFDTVENYLSCGIGIKEGNLVLPSVYEIIEGLSKKKAEGNEELQADLLTTGEIRDVLKTMYQYENTTAKYEGTPGNAMLADLQSKYYLAQRWTSDDLFGEGVDIGAKMNADSINFRDPKDEHGAPVLDDNNQVVHGIYRDTRGQDAGGHITDAGLASLRVNIAGNALADLLDSSGKLSSITEAGGNILKSVEIYDCSYSLVDGKTYAEFYFCAATKESEGESSSGMDVSTFLPDKIYLTAKVLLNSTAAYTEGEPRFAASIIINRAATATTNMFRMIKLLSGSSFDSKSVCDKITEAVSEAFTKIEESVNFVFGTEAASMALDNIFNTINKLSNKPTEADLADPAYVPYVSNTADDKELGEMLREFGRDPEAISTEMTLADTTKQTVVTAVDVTAYNGTFGIYYTDATHYNVPTDDDQKAFFAAFNDNFYIVNDEKKLSAAKVKSGNLVVDDTFISLATMYADNRAYDALKTYATDNRLASLINAMYDEGIEVKNDSDLIGTAHILAVHITTQKMLAFVQVVMNPLSANANKLPDYLYMVSETWLVDPDGAGDIEAYDTTVSINNMSTEDTDKFVDHYIGNLTKSLGLSLNLTMDTITKPVEDNIKDVFDTKLKVMGNVKYNEGSLEIPTIFAYLAEGKLTKDGSGNSNYNTAEYMVEIDVDDYIATHAGIDTKEDFYATADAEAARTNPEVLMYRLREMGKADYVADFADNMVIWSGGLPATSGDKYNTNTFDEEDEEDFYDQMQVYYFFAADKRPNKDWFNGGGSNIFNDLTTNFATSFNLYGYTDENITDNNLTLSAALTAYAKTGLYKYNGEQIGAKLSDKAMASLIKSQNAINISSSSIDNVAIESVELGYDDVAEVLTITITVKVTAKNTSSALPTTFYMTTQTTRNALGVYDTKMTLNRFAFGTATTLGDLDKFLNNLAFIDTLNIKDQLDTTAICNSVTDALQDMLDNKLAAYIKQYGNYISADSDKGKGYIELNNIYHEIVDKLNVTRADYTTAGVDHSDDIIQDIIYKLHNNQNPDTSDKAYVSYNAKTGTENITNSGLTYTVTDRAFANKLVDGLQTAKGAYVQDVDSIFFVGAADNDLFTAWQTSIATTTASGTFDISAAEAYIMATIEVDVTQTSASASVALLPNTLYLTLVVKYDDVQLNRSLVSSYINDFTYDENRMMMTFVSDTTGQLDFETTVMTIVNTYLPANCDFARYPDNTFADYVGKASYTVMMP